jgi:hypothetical protein
MYTQFSEWVDHAVKQDALGTRNHEGGVKYSAVATIKKALALTTAQ